MDLWDRGGLAHGIFGNSRYFGKQYFRCRSNVSRFFEKLFRLKSTRLYEKYVKCLLI